MRLTFCLLTMVFLQVSARGVAQKITYSGRNVPLTSVFSAIERQTGFLFFYNDKDLSGATAVTLQLKDATLKQALEDCFRGQPLNYVEKG
ncbi:MAG TPA: STN domain-containing protein, partial [Puia sp.]|nr:STN domain-containing protein [Puia sp.]